MKGNTKETQRNYKGTTKEIQREYKGNTKEIQRKYKGITKEIQRKYKGNTKAIQMQYKGNTNPKEFVEIVSVQVCKPQLLARYMFRYSAVTYTANTAVQVWGAGRVTFPVGAIS